ncbi:MAG: VIT domain-containing protein [Caldilineaceae bacterium]
MRSPLIRRLTATMLLLILLSATVLPAYAQQIIIDPPPLPPVPSVPNAISIDSENMDAVVDGPIATVHVAQVFRNISGATVEGRYIFPLPADAAVSDFQMTVDGQVVEGKLYSAEEARQIYEEIVRSLRDPALLEYVGNNLFQASVFPIPAGASRKVELTYTQILPIEEGLYRFHFPLRSPQSNGLPLNSLSLRVELKNQPGLRTIYSPSYNLDIQRQGDNGALIGYESQASTVPDDFDLYFGADSAQIGLNLLSYKPSDEDGYFLLLAAPAVETAQDEIVTRDIVVVLDVSGSMQGEKIEQARKAVRYVVDHLNPGDRFNLISFSTGTRLWQANVQDVNPTTLASARGWIDQVTAEGSTDINRALLEALAQFSQGDATRPAYLLFMTDGLPTQGETDANRIIANVESNLPGDRSIRLFSFGVGYDVNTDLLDTISANLRGRTTYVKPEEAIDEKVGNFYAQIGKPVLADVQIDFGANVVVDELYPYPLPDFFAGVQQVIVGRYHSGGKVDLALKGTVNGKKVSFNYPGRSVTSAGGEPFVARLWATRKIGTLLSQLRRGGTQDELIQEVVKLSLKYGIVTPYTSYLVQEPTVALGLPNAGEDRAPLLYSMKQAEESANAQVQSQVAVDAAAAPSGEAAVVASAERGALQEATVAESGPQQNLRYAAGHTFTYQGMVQGANQEQVMRWVDTTFEPTMQVEEVAFASARYFELAQQPDLAQIFAISPEVVVVTGANSAIHVNANSVLETQSVSPLPTPSPTQLPSATATPTPTSTSDSEKGWWESLWGWVSGK